MTTHEIIAAVRTDLNRVLLERESAIDNALLALLTRQHYFQVGSRGIAKTLLVDGLMVRIQGARVFQVALNPGKTADHVLGPEDLLERADHGKIVRMSARSFSECDIAFIDEIGRGNDLAYDVLLPLLDEKRTVNELGMPAPLTIPLVSCFAASNSHLLGERLEALNDRFLLREIILPVQERASKITLATTPPKPLTDIQATMTMDDLRAAQVEAAQTKLPGEVLDAALALDEALKAEGVSMSDRMWTWSFPLLRACGWLHGETETQLEDLAVLAHAWWQDPKQRDVVQRTILRVANPLGLEAQEMADQAQELLRSVPDVETPDFLDIAASVNAQLRDMRDALGAKINRSRARDKRQAHACLKGIHAGHKQLARQLAERMALGDVEVGDIVVNV